MAKNTKSKFYATKIIFCPQYITQEKMKYWNNLLAVRC